MKKYILMIFVTLSVILFVFAQGHTIIDNIEYADVITVTKKEAQEKLIFNGTVEYKESAACISSGTGIVASVLVQENTYVEKGTPIMIAMQTDKEFDLSEILGAVSSQNEELYSEFIEKNCKAVIYKAESNGYLRGLSAEKGGIFFKGDTLFSVSDESDYIVRINISEKDINKVKRGQIVSVLCKSGDKYSGVVESISDTAKQINSLTGQQSVIQAEIRFTDKEINVKQGYTVQCTVLTKSEKDVLLVPYSSVGKDENSESYVYLYEGKHFVKHYVVCGYEYSNGFEMISGLSLNDVIAADISEVKKLQNAVIGEVKNNEQ
ncbi:MAG: HlyD family efflux transporter periplasmic adaptor subunit [Acutalibacteraceae bacterium]|nr:HlyD family efflux transporter periplasmic adaptor subunit [Acutalibacteraceae bacterium]